MKKYILFFLCGPVANILWIFWALPEMNEEGGVFETFQWLATQIALAALFLVLLSYKRRYAYVLVAAFALYNLMHAAGLMGWGFMGLYTPPAVYLVAAILAIGSLGLFYYSMIDLGIGKKEKFYGFYD